MNALGRLFLLKVLGIWAMWLSLLLTIGALGIVGGMLVHNTIHAEQVHGID